MANNTKKVKYGNYICKVGNFDVYMKCSYSNPDAKGVRLVNKHDHCLYFAKRLVKNGFKTKQEAIDYAKTLPANFKVEKKRK